MRLIKNHTEQRAIHAAGKIVHQILTELEQMSQPGVSTLELEQTAGRLLAQYRSTAPFKQYDGFGYAICISLNEEVVNGPPSRNRILKTGDLVSIATAAEQRGIHAKAARTFYIGEQPPENIQRLLSGTSEVISQVIENSNQVESLNELLMLIPQTAQKYQLTILAELGGAAIGKKMHEEPYIPNIPEALTESIPLQPGFAFVLMPMFSLGSSPDIKMHEDGWTYVTADDALSAHFADTLFMTENGLINLTSPK